MSARRAVAPYAPSGERPLRVGIVNAMPHAVGYEDMLLPQFAAGPPVEPVWLRLSQRSYHLDDRADVLRRYRSYGEATRTEPLAGLIVTGAAVEHLPFEQVRFLPELRELLEYASLAQVPVLGMCWGALAVGHILLDLPHEVYREKVSGVHLTRRTSEHGPVARALDDEFFVPNSRFAGFSDAGLSQLELAGRVEVVARSGEAGVTIAQSPDQAVLMHVGHPEYGATRLVEEYRRDVGLRLNPRPPTGLDLERPVNRWRSHSLAFFAAWLGQLARTAPPPTAPTVVHVGSVCAVAP